MPTSSLPWVASRVNDAYLPPTIAGLQRALKYGTLSVPDALEMQARRLADCGAKYRCVVKRHSLERHVAAIGSLAGIGLAHKDIFDLVDHAPKCGAHTAPRRGPGRMARAIERLERAGASNLAALAMAEFACGATGENRNGPEPVNHLNADAVVGGSSSGSAAAVAAELCYASLGTDTAGSIRIPAATLGLVGLKPTLGLISTDGVFPLAPSLDCVGIIARTAADAAKILQVVAEHGEGPLLDPAYLRKSRHWQVNVDLAVEGLDSDVASVLTAFIAHLRATATVRRVQITNLDALTHSAEVVLDFEAARLHRRRLTGQPNQAPTALKWIALPGLVAPPAWYLRALYDRAALAQAFCQSALDAVDLLLLSLIHI